MEEIVAEQADLIAQLQDEVTHLKEQIADGGPDLYWEGVYERIRAAWDAWAFAELGTASPSELDLSGRPELQALWGAVR